MPGFERSFLSLAALVWLACGPALAQTKPAVAGPGPDVPRTAIFIGNSFFYFNNGLPGHEGIEPAFASRASTRKLR